jgi:hypothetical protein
MFPNYCLDAIAVPVAKDNLKKCRGLGVLSHSEATQVSCRAVEAEVMQKEWKRNEVIKIRYDPEIDRNGRKHN